MIVNETRLDIFQSKMQTITCPVNTIGTLGNGLAFAFKNRFPGLDAGYKKACRYNLFKMQGFYIFRVNAERQVLCFPTKHDWRQDSKMLYITDGLERIAADYKKHGITSLSLPALGCGKGNLDWDDVYPIIHEIMGPIDLPVEIALPHYHRKAS